MIARQEIHRIETRLDSVLGRAKTVDALDTESRADYAKYLCVLVSGLIEKAAYLSLLGYAQRKSAPKIQEYVKWHLARFQNAKAARLVELFRHFDSGWAVALDNCLVDENRDAIDSVVANKNRIAHGEDVGALSLLRIEEYYRRVKNVINHMMTICGC